MSSITDQEAATNAARGRKGVSRLFLRSSLISVRFLRSRLTLRDIRRSDPQFWYHRSRRPWQKYAIGSVIAFDRTVPLNQTSNSTLVCGSDILFTFLRFVSIWINCRSKKIVASLSRPKRCRYFIRWPMLITVSI